MPKPNNVISRIKAEAEAHWRAYYHALFLQRVDDLQQLCIDAAFMQANEDFHMGESRCAHFGLGMKEKIDQIAGLIEKDTADTEYSRAKVDERLKQICGKNFQPWEVRYGKTS